MGYFTPALYEVMEFEHDTGDGKRIGLDSYEIHDPEHRIVLNQLIIDEYLNREIGQETVPLFIHRLQLKMRQIMPFYNKMYASEEIAFDPIATFNLTTERADTTTESGTTGSTSGTNVTASANGRTINSDFPESMLSGSEAYANAGANSNSSSSSGTASTQNGSSTANGSLNGSTHVTGFQGSPNEALRRYRENILNIDMMIVRELNELFMLVLSTGDELLPDAGWTRQPFGYLGAY